jgi:hypothetical protein
MLYTLELELQETLEASEKLMATLNETWEDKLAKTQEIHIAREQALEELGISLDKDRALVGVHAPKKWPHLVNLNEVRKGPAHVKSSRNLFDYCRERIRFRVSASCTQFQKDERLSAIPSRRLRPSNCPARV